VRAVAPEGDTSVMPGAMTIVAHPDDETIALGARLGRFSAAHLVHVTDGVPRNGQDSRTHGFASFAAYREARAKELDRALSLAGLCTVSRECLHIPDQEASFRLLELTRQIADILRIYKPEIIFTHPYEGGHPDHDACAFAVHHAAVIEGSYSGLAPLIIEATFYHAGPQGIATGAFLPSSAKPLEASFLLTPEERARKEALFACFTTQQDTLRYFPRDAERFRIAPEYDFRTPPHPAPVFYDGYLWGMTSQRFCDMARSAESALEQQTAVACH
jgi:N-acetylglucosamine malate deacetylase 2